MSRAKSNPEAVPRVHAAAAWIQAVPVLFLLATWVIDTRVATRVPDSSLGPRATAPFVLATDDVETEGVDDELRRLAKSMPGVARYHVIGRSLENRPIGALEIALESRNGEPRPEIYLQCGIHAREWVTPLLGLNLARHLMQGAQSDLLRRIRIWLVPMLNPDGYEFSRISPRPQGPGDEALWRKNRRPNRLPGKDDSAGPSAGASGNCGVDLNRNFDVDWRRLGSVNPAHNTFRGIQPASEPEVLAVQALLARRPFVFGLDVHSGGPYQLHAPWRIDREAPMAEEVVETGRRIFAAFRACAPPPAWGPRDPDRFLFEASAGGQTVNYFHHREQMVGFTVEIGRFFDGVPTSDRKRLLQAWIAAAMAGIRSVDAGPGIIGRVLDAASGRPLAAQIAIRDRNGSRMHANRLRGHRRSRSRSGAWAAWLLPGDYTVSVAASGYETREIAVSLSDSASPGDRWRRCDLALSRRP